MRGRGGRVAVHLAVLVLFLAAQATAQPAEDSRRKDSSLLATGSRVRVTAPDVLSQQAVGKVEHWTPDSLVLRLDPDPDASPSVPPPATVSVPRKSITRLEASEGVKGHAVRGACFGFLIGSVAGLFIAEAVAGEGADPYSTDFHGEEVAIVWAGTAVLSAVLGGILGSSEKSERWRKVGGF